MNNYIFLTENFTEGDTVYLAIDADKIETLNVSSTYDKYGQPVSNSDAGDSLDLLTNVAIDIANDAIGSANYFEQGNVVSAFETPTAFDDILELLQKHNLIEGVDFTMYKETVKGFNYWDGSNYKTITTQVENGEATHTILDDERLIAELNEAIENSKFIKEGFGTKIYEANGWTVENNYCQGVWDAYRVYTQEVEA